MSSQDQGESDEEVDDTMSQSSANSEEMSLTSYKYIYTKKVGRKKKAMQWPRCTYARGGISFITYER